MATWTPPTPGELIEVVEYGHTAIRCPSCKRWSPRLLISEVVDRPAEATLLCADCTEKARAR